MNAHEFWVQNQQHNYGRVLNWKRRTVLSYMIIIVAYALQCPIVLGQLHRNLRRVKHQVSNAGKAHSVIPWDLYTILKRSITQTAAYYGHRKVDHSTESPSVTVERARTTGCKAKCHINANYWQLAGRPVCKQCPSWNEWTSQGHRNWRNLSPLTRCPPVTFQSHCALR